MLSASGCARSPTSVAGSALAGWQSCSGVKARGMNLKKVYRLYREERLTVRRRGGRKRALGTRAPIAIPQERNQRWSLDFVSDALACGRQIGRAHV